VSSFLAAALSGNNLRRAVSHPCASVIKQWNWYQPRSGQWRPMAGQVTIRLALHCLGVTDF